MTKDFIPAFQQCTMCGSELPRRASDIRRHYRDFHKVTVDVAKGKYKLNRRKIVKIPNGKSSQSASDTVFKLHCVGKGQSDAPKKGGPFSKEHIYVLYVNEKLEDGVLVRPYRT